MKTYISLKESLSEGRKQLSKTSLLDLLQSHEIKESQGAEHRTQMEGTARTCINTLPVTYTTTMTSCPEADLKHLELLNEQSI